MKKKERKDKKDRISLSLLFTGITFAFLIITMLLVTATIIILINTGVLKLGEEKLNVILFIIWIAIASVVLGTVITFFVGRLPLKPVNSFITAMNKLASGDYKTRLQFKNPIAKNPTVAELTECFNNMANELEDTEMLRNDFINNFSHEFKTPIVSIAGFAKLLKRGNLTEEQKAEYIDIIEEESLRLSNMATNVLDLTKVENTSILTGKTTYNLSEQIRKCLLVLEPKIEKKNVELEVDFNEYNITANEEMLMQVWMNLIDNAVKFVYEYGTIKIDIASVNNVIVVSIANTGDPIPEQSMQKIFRKFYQADESHASEGNGIGLAVVRKVVDLHNGDINVTCENGVTTFKIYLPQ